VEKDFFNSIDPHPHADHGALALATARDYPGVIVLRMTTYADQRGRASGPNWLTHDVVIKPFTLATIRAADSKAPASGSAVNNP
jgi:hypothetical protein